MIYTVCKFNYFNFGLIPCNVRKILPKEWYIPELQINGAIEDNSNIQSTLVISTSVISNNCLSRREKLVLVLTQKCKLRLQNIVEKRKNCSRGAIFPLFLNIFNIFF